MFAHFVKSYSNNAPKAGILRFLCQKSAIISILCAKMALRPKYLLIGGNNQELTLSGRRWIDHGSSKEGSGKEAGSKETRSKESSGEEEVIFLHLPYAIFEIILKFSRVSSRKSSDPDLI